MLKYNYGNYLREEIMQINQAYTEHVNIVKDLKMTESFYEVREPYKEGFEEIYNRAKDENVNISNAKEFLSSLSKEELDTLQHFSGLADDINVEGLSDEGSYNLLLNHYERYDFDNDGLVSAGRGNTIPLIPQNMSSEDKKALVDTVNEMGMDNAFLGLSMIIFSNMTINGPTNDRVDYSSIKERMESILDPENKKYSTLEFRESINNFWTAFQDNYNKNEEESTYAQNNLLINSNLIKAKILNENQS